METSIQAAELFVGRKRYSASGNIRLVVTPGITTIHADRPSVAVVTSQTYQVFIDDKLFAAIKTYPKRPRLHSPISVTKDVKTGKVQLHLVKKYAELL